MTQITACHLQPYALRRPPTRRPLVPADAQARGRTRTFVWLVVLASLLALGGGASVLA